MLSWTDPLRNNLFPAFLSLVASKSLDQNFFTSSHTKMSICKHQIIFNIKVDSKSPIIYLDVGLDIYRILLNGFVFNFTFPAHCGEVPQ